MGDDTTTDGALGTKRRSLVEWRAAMAKGDGTSVYLIQCGPYLQIMSAADPAERLQELTRSGPPVRLLAVLNPRPHGWSHGRSFEAHLFRQFADQRIQHDWFELTGPLKNWVDGVILGLYSDNRWRNNQESSDDEF